MLHDAKNGELTGFAGISLHRGGGVGLYFVGQCANAPFDATAALQRLVGKIGS